MKNVISSYVSALDELNILVKTSYTRADGDFDKRVATITDDILSFLILAYKRGIEACGLMLGYDELTVDITHMYDVIYREIDGMTFEDRIPDYVLFEEVWAIERLVETEYHRVFNEAIEEGARQYVHEGGEAVKTWITAGDDRVRDTHDYLEGVTIPLDEEFVTIGGDSASAPGKFLLASNNINCRCILEISPVE